MKYFKFVILSGLSNTLLFYLSTLTLNLVLKETKASWLNSLVSKILNEHKVYQVLLLFDQIETYRNPKIEKITSGISRSFPTWKISFQEATEEKAKNLSLQPQFQDPRTTTLIMIVHSYRNKENDLFRLAGPTKFLFKLSESKIRPNCLIILIQKEKNSNYTDLLRQMWSGQFLDATILEIVESDSENSGLFFERHAEDPTIHRFNPFTNSSQKEKYSRKVSWFPDKARNIQGHQMKVGVFNYPASITLKRNRTGHVFDAVGPDAAMVKTLSRAMNFKILWINPKEDDWGTASCIKSKNTGLLYSLIKNEIQFIASHSGNFHLCEKELHDVASSSLVPIIGSNFYKLLYKSSEGYSRVLLDKSAKLRGSGKLECLDVLKREKNVACILREDVARSLVENEKDSCGKPIMKFVKESLFSTADGLYMESRSPYARRFDEIIQRIVEAGFPDLWRQNVSNRLYSTAVVSESCVLKSPETATINRLVMWTLLFGYMLSTFAFVCEVLLFFLIKNGLEVKTAVKNCF